MTSRRHRSRTPNPKGDEHGCLPGARDGTPSVISSTVVLARAKGQIGLHTIYRLGHGGFRPEATQAADVDKLCDCSGFIAWCLCVSRHTDNPWYRKQNGGWLETSAIYRDCDTPFGFFDKIEWEAARPTDLLVWGDSGGHQGHVGMVAEIDEWGPKYVIHCSKGNFKSLGDAISQTPVAIFKQHDARVARCAWVEP